MAGDWIKMRTSLLTNPKVNGIARQLEESREVSSALSTGFKGGMNEIVTRNVMRHVTVSSLLIIWGAANEHTKDGVFLNADLSDIDDMVGIPGFGVAMEAVGWAFYDAEKYSVVLPNFNEYNTSGAVRSAGAKSAAERQREYRERKKSQESDVTRDVTVTATSDRREEKRREDKKEKTLSDSSDVAEVISHLNLTTGAKYRVVEANAKLVRARLSEGATVQEMKSVINAKAKEWTGSEQARYLRPETLFNATKYAQYAGQIGVNGANVLQLEKRREVAL